MAVVEDSGLRRAALTLHALSSDDRARVWQRLDQTRRALLDPLLVELVQLGIPQGRPWMDEHALRSSGRHLDQVDQTDPAESSESLRRQVAALEAAQVHAALLTQSSDTAAVILNSADWPWRNVVLEQWPATSRHALSGRLSDDRSDAPPALLNQLLRSLLAACAQTAGGHACERQALQPAPTARRRWHQSVASLFQSN